jgi:hypothetical protein
MGSKGEKTLNTLFYQGASMSFIHPDVLSDLATPVQLRRIRELATAVEGHFIEVKYGTTLDFYIDDVLLSDEFFIVPNLSEEAIIGATTLHKWGIKLDVDHDQVIVDPKRSCLSIRMSSRMQLI